MILDLGKERTDLLRCRYPCLPILDLHHQQQKLDLAHQQQSQERYKFTGLQKFSVLALHIEVDEVFHEVRCAPLTTARASFAFNLALAAKPADST